MYPGAENLTYDEYIIADKGGEESIALLISKAKKIKRLEQTPKHLTSSNLSENTMDNKSNESKPKVRIHQVVEKEINETLLKVINENVNTKNLTKKDLIVLINGLVSLVTEYKNCQELNLVNGHNASNVIIELEDQVTEAKSDIHFLNRLKASHVSRINSLEKKNSELKDQLDSLNVLINVIGGKS